MRRDRVQRVLDGGVSHIGRELSMVFGCEDYKTLYDSERRCRTGEGW